MKPHTIHPPLMQRPLMFPTAQAYASVAYGPEGRWVERSAKGMSLGEPIGVDVLRTRGVVANGLVGGAGAAERPSRREDIEALCGNPLRDQPNPVVVKAVRRFGLVGLVSCAVFTGVARGWHSLSHRKH
jgi:hypothetical protein